MSIQPKEPGRWMTLINRKCDTKTITAIEAARNIAADREQVHRDFDATFFSS
jgi:hypothetical protein